MTREIKPRGIKMTGRTERLAPRHFKAAVLIAEGMGSKQIAARMGITDGALKVYVSEIYRLTKSRTRVDIANWVRSCDFAAPDFSVANGEGVRMGAFE